MKSFPARKSHLVRLVSFSLLLAFLLSAGPPIPTSDAARHVQMPEGFPGGGTEGKPDDPGKPAPGAGFFDYLVLGFHSPDVPGYVLRILWNMARVRF